MAATTAPAEPLPRESSRQPHPSVIPRLGDCWHGRVGPSKPADEGGTCAPGKWRRLGAVDKIGGTCRSRLGTWDQVTLEGNVALARIACFTPPADLVVPR